MTIDSQKITDAILESLEALETSSTACLASATEKAVDHFGSLNKYKAAVMGVAAAAGAQYSLDHCVIIMTPDIVQDITKLGAQAALDLLSTIPGITQAEMKALSFEQESIQIGGIAASNSITEQVSRGF